MMSILRKETVIFKKITMTISIKLVRLNL